MAKNKNKKEPRKKIKKKNLKKQKREKKMPPKAEKKVLPVVQKTKIKIIGIGGGAGTIISEISSRVKKADFVLTDTVAPRKNSSKIKKVFLGEGATYGFGTGMDPDLGESSATLSKEKIEKILSGQDICIIVSCLGGGAGSGAMPIFAKEARKMNILTYGIFTLPFNFEGERKKGFAFSSIEKAKPYLNAYSLIPNEKIFEIIDKQTPIKEALSIINRHLAENLEGLIEMIHSPGVINIDFADFRTILSGKGQLAFLNSYSIDRENIMEDLKKITSDPFSLYPASKAKGILYNILGGEDLCLSEVSMISRAISNSASRKAKIIFGINQSKKNKNKIKTILLAVGCGESEAPSKKKNKKIKKNSSKKEIEVKTKERKEDERRRNGLQIQEENQKIEKGFLEEDSYETPAILRKIK
ncbi:MAG: cell division protein FtsZ [Candidatus Pacebacteria bacterium]|nr:cell division protein FtsZ [Candidatus Paceibacterota bacterium]